MILASAAISAMNTLSFSGYSIDLADLLILFPSIIAIFLIFAFYRFLYYVFGRLLLKKWYVIGLRLWAMSGINLEKLPLYCPFDCSISVCKNWTCPNYSKYKSNE